MNKEKSQMLSVFSRLLACCKPEENFQEIDEVLVRNCQRRNEESKEKEDEGLKREEAQEDNGPASINQESEKSSENQEEKEEERGSRDIRVEIPKENQELIEELLQMAQKQKTNEKQPLKPNIQQTYNENKNQVPGDGSNTTNKERKAFDYSLCPKAPKPRNQKRGSFNIPTIKVPQSTPMVYNPSAIVINTIIRPTLKPPSEAKEKKRVVKSLTMIEKSKKERKMSKLDLVLSSKQKVKL